MTETLVATVNRAETLSERLQALHRRACDEDPMLALLVQDLVATVSAVHARLREIETVRKS